LIVLMIVKGLSTRQAEEYSSENAPARIFISRQKDPVPHVRDHSNIARAYVALGSEGIEEVNRLVLTLVVGHGLGDPRKLSGDTTAAELPIGYPNEPGILRGLAQRCARASENLKKKGIENANSIIEKAGQVIRSAKEYHLFAKETEEKQTILQRMVKETKSLLKEAGKFIKSVKDVTCLIIKNSIEKLESMKKVGKQLIPQIIHYFLSI